MLAYAFQNLKEEDMKYFDSEDFENIHELMAAILIRGISAQLKQGLYREYQQDTDVINFVRGKIDIATTIKQNTLQNRQIVCSYDKFTENNILNQILKTTSIMLLRHSELRKDFRKKLKKLILYFVNVDLVDPQVIKWKSLDFNRNNTDYKMLMNICILVLKGLLLKTETGKYKLSQYLEDQDMHRLFERFVLKFYQREYPTLKANASLIKWNVDNGISDLLPRMKTDIMLQIGEKTLIIDTKYYSKNMQKSAHSEKLTFISSHLYQLFTYVKNMDEYNTGNVSGVLLYANTDEELMPNNDYSMSGNRISIKTLDLNGEWEDIKYQLKCIAEMLVID